MMRFLDFLFPPRADEVALRGVSADDFLALMRVRLVDETQPDTIGLLPFNDPRVRSAIHEAKYHGNERAFELLSAALIEYLLDADEGFRKSIIVPVPLGNMRFKERGFNQVQEVARRAATQLDYAVDQTLLERTRETASQVSLPRTLRLENMKGAFVCPSKLQERSRTATYIVIDDVITTGATLQAAIDALKEAGAEHIVPLALAH